MDATTIPANTVSFRDYLFKDKRNRTILILAAVAMVIQFGVFKYFYPFASYIHGDSFEYLNAAHLNLKVNSYLIGYSKFLRIFSVFTRSDLFLTTFQYILAQAGGLLFLFSLSYFFRINKTISIILTSFIVFNPLFLYMANMVSSDCIFLAISLTWLTTLLWIINRPTTRMMLYHSLILFIAFTVRYNALIYPLISIIAFGMSGIPLRKKIAGLAPGIILCGLFILYTAYKFKVISGQWQYSPFSGWQMANNAMYTYRYVDIADRKPVPTKFSALDQMIRTHYDSTWDFQKYPQEGLQASTFYMWRPELPLQRYMNIQFAKDSSARELKKWSTMGPFYSEYGKFIIMQYPIHYLKFYLLPNTYKFFTPPLEYLSQFNSDKDTVLNIAKEWFDYKSNKITSGMHDLKIRALNFYPILTGIANAIFVVSFVCFIILGGFKNKDRFSKFILLVFVFWFVNAGFSIFATAGALRFLSFSSILSSLFDIVLINWVWAIAISEEGSKEYAKGKTNLHETMIKRTALP
jgi:hypothetical protein